MWEFLDTGTQSAEANMALDAKLLEELKPDGAPILHFYDWLEDSATYGYFLNPSRFLNLAKAEKRGLSLARRPTGGGIVFHVSDLAFSVLVPSGYPHFSLNTLDNYNFINNAVKKAVKNFFKSSRLLNLLPEEPTPLDESCRHFCMAKPTKYDVMLDGRKVAGAAQRRRKQGFLHQGTISLALPAPELLEDILLPDTQVHQAMRHNTFSLLGSSWTSSDLADARQELKKLLKNSLMQV